MSEVPVSVGCQYMVTKQYFLVVDFRQKMRASLAPVEKMYLAALRLTNIRNCIYTNQTAQSSSVTHRR